MKRARRKMRCSIHSARYLVLQNTRWGRRYSCPVGGCTVVSWNGNSPADYSTRQARMKAHDLFDKLWKSGMFDRKGAYKELAHFLGISVEKTHIANFDQSQCQATIHFANMILEDK